MSAARNEPGSTQELPADRFDRLPKAQRVGAHRISGKLSRFWRYFLAAVIATAVLITAGVIGLNVIDYHGTETQSPTVPEENTEPDVVPELDPTASVVVLNGTPTPNLASGVDQVITANQWGQIALSDNASSRDVAISAVFYSDAADLPAAEGLARELGGVSTYQTENYADLGVRLVVLLGADYAGPGFDEAAQITAQLRGDETTDTP